VDGIILMRQAYQLDENDSIARAVLANALVEHAHALVETDWKEAEKLSKEALDLNPGHPMAKTIRVASTMPTRGEPSTAIITPAT